MEIRPARPTDAGAIGRYHHRCWLVGYAGLVDQAVLDDLDEDARIQRWTDRLRHGDEGTWVADEDGVAIGHLLVEDDVVVNIYVDPDHWGRGIGAALLDVAEDRLRAAGLDRGVLWVLVGNERALGLYTRAGWALDGTTEAHAASGGVEVVEHRMVKDLTPPT